MNVFFIPFLGKLLIFYMIFTSIPVFCHRKYESIYHSQNNRGRNRNESKFLMFWEFRKISTLLTNQHAKHSSLQHLQEFVEVYTALKNMWSQFVISKKCQIYYYFQLSVKKHLTIHFILRIYLDAKCHDFLQLGRPFPSA